MVPIVLLTEVLENHIVFGKRLEIEGLKEKDVVMKNIAGWTLRVNLYRQSKFYQVNQSVLILVPLDFAS